MTNQMNKYTNKQLMTAAQQLTENYTDDADVALNLVMAELENRLDEDSFINFCDTL